MLTGEGSGSKPKKRGLLKIYTHDLRKCRKEKDELEARLAAVREHLDKFPDEVFEKLKGREHGTPREQFAIRLGYVQQWLGELSQLVNSDSWLTEEEKRDVEDSMREIASGKAKKYGNAEELIAGLEREEGS